MSTLTRVLRCRINVTLACAFLFLAFNVDRARANIIATSYDNPCAIPNQCSYEGGSSPSPYPTLEQQFTLTSEEDLASVDAALAYSIDDGSFPAQDLEMTVVNDNSGAPGNTTYATDNEVLGTLSEFPISGTYADINFRFSDVALSPGTYWLVIQIAPAFSGNPHLFDWEYQGTYSSTGSGGTINQVSGFGSTYTTNTYMTTLNSTPEPATILLSLSALTALWAFRRRRS